MALHDVPVHAALVMDAFGIRSKACAAMLYPAANAPGNAPDARGSPKRLQSVRGHTGAKTCGARDTFEGTHGLSWLAINVPAYARCTPPSATRAGDKGGTVCNQRSRATRPLPCAREGATPVGNGPEVTTPGGGEPGKACRPGMWQASPSNWL